jgi:hypothetical protein
MPHRAALVRKSTWLWEVALCPPFENLRALVPLTRAQEKVSEKACRKRTCKTAVASQERSIGSEMELPGSRGAMEDWVWLAVIMAKGRGPSWVEKSA